MQTNYQAAAAARITVVGDVILDRYLHGAASRISPEAPVPVVRVQREEERLGGAANVALNIARLGVAVRLLGITGEDAGGQRLKAMLAEQGIAHVLLQQADFPTVTKVRALSRNQQLLRLDYEPPAYMSDKTSRAALLEQCRASLEDSTLLVLSDYAKGSVQDAPALIEAAKARGIPVLIDPKCGDFGRYAGAAALTPNLAEFEAVAGRCPTEQCLAERAQALCRQLNIGSLLITRGAQGISLIDPARELVCHLPAARHEVFDVTGAGDTVIATYAAAMASGYSAEQAVDFANHAAGLVIARIGTASVTAAELNRAMRGAMYARAPLAQPLLDMATLGERIAQARAAGERLVFTNGCFDILHAGHIACLEQAKALGQRLIVALNDDASVALIKGAGRPINPLQRRAQVISALAAVDWVVSFSEATPARLLAMVRPDVLVKGGDYRPDQVAGAEHVLAGGGEVRIIPRLSGLSTTAIVARINKHGGGKEEDS